MADSPSPRRWTTGELAYFAGIIDGEGHFNARIRRNNRGNPYHDVALCVCSTDRGLTDWLERRFGGATYIARPAQDRHRELHGWRLHAAALERLLPWVLPYLVIKQRQAELVLALRATVNLGTNRLSPATRNRRAAIYGELRSLTKRGRDGI